MKESANTTEDMDYDPDTYEPTDDELRILARTECLLLWDRLAETGSDDKPQTLIELYNEGKIHKRSYKLQCPLCDYSDNECIKCIWPKAKKINTRCCLSGSPYLKWEEALPDTIKIYAQKVFNLIYNADF